MTPEQMLNFEESLRDLRGDYKTLYAEYDRVRSELLDSLERCINYKDNLAIAVSVLTMASKGYDAKVAQEIDKALASIGERK